MALGLTAMTGCTEDGQSDAVATGGFVLADCATLVRPDQPNTWLAAGQGPCAAIADEPAPTYPAPAAAVSRAWQDWIATQARAQTVRVSDDGLAIDATERSAVFGFVDDVAVRVFPLGEDAATVAVYSRSRVGYWDFGANRARVRDWIEGVRQRLAAQ